MRPVYVTLQAAAADADGIAQSQTPGAAGALTLNGAFVAGGVATLDVQRRVLLTGAGNDSARTFVVTGTNGAGMVISESLAGPNAGTVSTVRDFKTITSVTVDAATAGAIEVGTSGVAATMPLHIDIRQAPTNVALAVNVIGVVNYTIQHTLDDIWDPAFYNGPVAPVWFDHPTLAAQTTNKDSNYAFPPRAIRLVINSGAGSARLAIVEATNVR